MTGGLHRHPLRAIEEAATATYERDGVVLLRGMFGGAWIARLADGAEQAMAAPGPHAEEYTPAGRSGRFFGDLDVWQRHEPFRRFVLDSPAGEIVGRVMGAAQATFLYDQLLVKEPGTGERTPWHQDQPYWRVDGRQVASLWLPLDPVPRAVSVEYVAGSHRWGEAFNPQHFSDGAPYVGTGLPTLPDFETERGRHRILAFDLEPGDCLVFQAMIVHGAPGNPGTARRRRALATRWLGEDARYRVRPGETAIPTFDPGLADGDPVAGPLFPTVWRRHDG